ncbi:uncharacterized protein B0H18DRAFT_1210862 [Fomitopsis serialis]|uniref:uncharacterized protein n=1 Tax=Fomitopsis serialis TaxID=139415 RepID=UPI0020086BD8|nr:uncharacterized protein B0H18DRAFT_1210862 [Neoantrodia serialis]KAH9926967.1 hypothetical protein B0H18DRAFT_1210862 [Neoantrodia serialis]
MTGLTALILGATGATGKVLLQELLASPQYSSVSEYGRRVTAPEKITAGNDKLEQRTIDFEKLEDAGLKDRKWDVIFITLGTTRKAAGSLEAFEKIDREYVVNAARLAKSDDPAQKQRLIYLSSGGANPDSYFPYMRSKGLTELALADLGYNDTIVFRPGALGDAERPTHRVVETVSFPVIKAMSRFIPSLYMPVPKLAKALRAVGEKGTEGIPAERVQKMGAEKAPWSLLDNNSILAIADAFN